MKPKIDDGVFRKIKYCSIFVRVQLFLFFLSSSLVAKTQTIKC